VSMDEACAHGAKCVGQLTGNRLALCLRAPARLAASLSDACCDMSIFLNPSHSPHQSLFAAVFALSAGLLELLVFQVAGFLDDG